MLARYIWEVIRKSDRSNNRTYLFAIGSMNILVREGETINGESVSLALANSDVVLQADDITSQSDRFF